MDFKAGHISSRVFVVFYIFFVSFALMLVAYCMHVLHQNDIWSKFSMSSVSNSAWSNWYVTLYVKHIVFFLFWISVHFVRLHMGKCISNGFRKLFTTMHGLLYFLPLGVVLSSKQYFSFYVFNMQIQIFFFPFLKFTANCFFTQNFTHKI